MTVATYTIRESGHPVVVCVPVCQVDADLWLTQLLSNLSQFPYGITWYCDNLDAATLSVIREFPGTCGMAVEGDPSVPFSEDRRNYPLKLARIAGASWWLRMDVDETLEPNAGELIENLIGPSTPTCSWKFRWYNVWRSAKPFPLIRFDPPFCPHNNYRVALHPFHGGYRWRFRHGSVASAYCDKEIEENLSDVRLIHWGFSTPELRLFHKRRWDRLYVENPHGMWNAACDEGKEAWLWPWMPWLTHEEFVREVDRAHRLAPESLKQEYLPSWAKRV